MVELRVLGTLELTSGGIAVSSVLAQPRRTAFLCYLAIARPVGFHSRDTLFSLFWPEHDTESARHALRQSVYFLRRSLGSEVIVSRGDEALGIDRHLFACDLWAFGEAIAKGELERAVGLATGELLPGFYISDAPGFERWLEDERFRVRRDAADAAWSLADRAEAAGDRTAAAGWAKRAAGFSPFDELELRRLLEVLERLGDSVSALRAYDTFADAVRKEYGMGPSEETSALADRIRIRIRHAEVAVKETQEAQHPSTAGPSPMSSTQPTTLLAGASPHPEHSGAPVVRRTARPGPGLLVGVAGIVAMAVLASKLMLGAGPAPGGIPSIAVLPFASTGADIGNARLANGMTDDLITALARAGRFRVSSATSSFALRGRPIDARAAGDRLGAAYLLEGTLDVTGDSSRVNARLVDAATGVALWSNSYRSSVPGLVRVQEEIVRAVGRALNVSIVERSGVEPALTRGYILAHELTSRANDPSLQRTDAGSRRMLDLYRRAVEADSAYAPAYAGLAHAYMRVNFGMDGEMKYDEALTLAEEAASRALSLDSLQAYAFDALGKVRLHSYRFAEAETLFHRALELDPDLIASREHLIQLDVFLGRPREAVEHARVTLRENPLSSYLTAELARALLVAGDCDEAMRQLALIENLDPPVARAFPVLAQCHALQGRSDDAVATMRADQNRIPYSEAVLGYYLARAGQRGEARRILRQLVERYASIGSAYPVAVVYTGLAENDSALVWMDRAVDDRSVRESIMEPLFAELRAQPGFLPIARRLGIPATF